MTDIRAYHRHCDNLAVAFPISIQSGMLRRGWEMPLPAGLWSGRPAEVVKFYKESGRPTIDL
jgi:hypothetical protein